MSANIIYIIGHYEQCRAFDIPKGNYMGLSVIYHEYFIYRYYIYGGIMEVLYTMVERTHEFAKLVSHQNLDNLSSLQSSIFVVKTG